MRHSRVMNTIRPFALTRSSSSTEWMVAIILFLSDLHMKTVLDSGNLKRSVGATCLHFCVMSLALGLASDSSDTQKVFMGIGVGFFMGFVAVAQFLEVPRVVAHAQAERIINPVVNQ